MPLQVATAKDYQGAQTGDCSEQQLWCSKQNLQSHASSLRIKTAHNMTALSSTHPKTLKLRMQMLLLLKQFKQRAMIHFHVNQTMTAS